MRSSLIRIYPLAILIFLSLFILQILKSVGAQEDANDSTTDNKRMDVSQLQQRQEPLNGALQQTQPQQMQKKQAYDDEIALDYDEVYKLIEKNGGGSLFENVSEIDDYIGEEIDKILNNGPPPQELQPFIEATDKIVDGYQFAIEPAVATHPIVQGTTMQYLYSMSFGNLTIGFFFCVCNKLPYQHKQPRLQVRQVRQVLQGLQSLK